MTREERQEAKAQLERISKNLASIGESVDYTEFAIEALEQEPCDDCISRQSLLDRINKAEETFKYDHIESISSCDEDPFVDGVLSAVFSIRQLIIMEESEEL